MSWRCRGPWMWGRMDFSADGRSSDLRKALYPGLQARFFQRAHKLMLRQKGSETWPRVSRTWAPWVERKRHPRPRCLIPWFDGALFSGEWKDGTNSSRLRHDDRVDPSSGTAHSSEPDRTLEALRHQPEDRRQMEEAEPRWQLVDRAERAEIHSPVD